MTTYILFQGIKAIQSAPGTVQGGTPGSNLPPGSTFANPGGGAGAPTAPPTNQTLHAVVAGTSGSVSATVQPVVSNDGINWIAYGSPITIASAATPQQGSAVGTAVWAFYSAYVTAISGTGASVTCTMNA